MPRERFIADALSVLTISLVAALVLLGLFCIAYTFYFHKRIYSHALFQFNYFSGPWIIRITYIFLALWWGVGEIVRLELLRHNRRILGGLSLRLQENICKCYIISNLGFSEPCLLLTLIFLLRSSVQRSGALSREWNAKTACFILLYSIPMIILQLVVTVIGPKYKDELLSRLPLYFIKAAGFSNTSGSISALCTYPLFSTIILGIFATMLTGYLFVLGSQILHLVINKVLQKRVYALIISISSLFLLRILLLGLSVLVSPENATHEVMLFLAFASLLCCVLVGMWILVYLPVTDSLALWDQQGDTENARTEGDAHNESVSLIGHNLGRESTDSENCGSISFRVRGKEGACGEDFVELSIFSPSEHSTPPGSPRVLGWPQVPIGGLTTSFHDISS